VSSEEAGSEKPHSSPFLLATHKLWVLASECVMVGDSIARDIEWGMH
jgi:FMN phosphatase YigB (HAD superfamily)